MIDIEKMKALAAFADRLRVEDTLCKHGGFTEEADLIYDLLSELEAREADRRDAERHRFLRKRVIYEGSSDWTIEVSGRFASFEEALEYQMSLARRQEGGDDAEA